MSTELREFVRDALARGASRDAIRAALASAGWLDDEVAAELARWADVAFAVPVPKRKASLSARESFLYLVLFATLYIAAFNSGSVLFNFIERIFPDPVRGDWRNAAQSGLRLAVASLVIALPVFLYTQRLIARSIGSRPEHRISGIRRWLTYLTLFVAALVLIGDFVAVVSGLLSGELVPRFLAKCVAVFAIAAIGFRHYLADLRRDETEAPVSAMRSSWLGRIGVIGMAVIALAGLIVAGTPRQARLIQIDEQRVRDLGEIAAAIETWHKQYGALPESLERLHSAPNPRLGGLPLADPETGVPYEYAVLGSLRYQLCATFARADEPSGRRGVDPFWRHAAGRHCFMIELPPRRE